MTYLVLAPLDVHFSQDSIAAEFQNRGLIGKLLDDIVEGLIKVEDIKRIKVIERNGQYYSDNNRRLWVFHQLQRLGKCDEIQVKYAKNIYGHNFTAKDDGTSVRIRGNDPCAGSEWCAKMIKAGVENSPPQVVQAKLKKKPRRRRKKNKAKPKQQDEHVDPISVGNPTVGQTGVPDNMAAVIPHMSTVTPVIRRQPLTPKSNGSLIRTPPPTLKDNRPSALITGMHTTACRPFSDGRRYYASPGRQTPVVRQSRDAEMTSAFDRLTVSGTDQKEFTARPLLKQTTACPSDPDLHSDTVDFRGLEETDGPSNKAWPAEDSMFSTILGIFCCCTSRK